MGSFVRRAAFALRFGDINPLISNYITGESKILYVRDMSERVRLLAPFLDFDSDPYPVVVDGKLVWIIDAYTTTDQYPYAQRAVTGQLPPGSELEGNVQLRAQLGEGRGRRLRRHGHVLRRRSDRPAHPGLPEGVPELFTDGSKIPAALRAHLRYPEDLFRVQTNMWGRYHIEDAVRVLQPDQRLERRPGSRHGRRCREPDADHRLAGPHLPEP